MTNRVKNSASPTMTWLGGADWVPRAWRSSESTMMMRVKLVIINSAAGKNVSEVMSNSVCTGSE